ncbi:MAG: hypothetical protein GY807_04820 [Gammaproteobacteria bacterium]|nr:hypothetical protein [Gammaproteobacteria bacterium]
MKTFIHPLGGVIATLCIATFFTSTVVVELIGSHDAIATVKGLIVMPGLFILIPAIAATGGTGFALGKGRKGRLSEAKKKRMPIIGANGVLVLLPAAIFLDQWASAGAFDTKFYLVQGLELIAGAVNLTLMGMNIRDGLKMTGRMRSKPKHLHTNRA